MIRSFVGLRIPPEVVPRLIAAQAGLPACRAVAPENFHLTLAFLGENPEPLVEDVHHALSDIRAQDFEVELDGLDAFGGPRIRSVCARAKLSPGLEGLHGSVRQAVRMAGLSLPRARYTPHVTLARCNGQGAGGEDAQKLRDFAARGAGFRARFAAGSFALIDSHLRQSGPIYVDLAEYALR